jgi:hypothetical protein
MAVGSSSKPLLHHVIPSQSQHAVPERARRGVVPGGDHEHDHSDDEVIAERLAIDLGRREPSHQIIPGFETPARHQLLDVRSQNVGRGLSSAFFRAFLAT